MPVSKLKKSDKIEIEDCPICYNAFHKEEIVYRPLLNGKLGKRYHKKCLEEWCKKSGQSCVDPVTTIKFNILNSKKCNYSRSYEITLHIENERILLGTEPCDQFYDIKKFISAQHRIPMEFMTLYHIKGNERIPVVESSFIGDDLELELAISANMDGFVYDDNFDYYDYYDKKDKNNIEQLVEDIKDIETLAKNEHLSPEEIKRAVNQLVDIDDFTLSFSIEESDFFSIENTTENTIDFEIRESKELIEEIDHTLSTLSPNDPKRSQLEIIQSEEKNKYKKLLIKGILILYKNVKHVLSRFLSSSGDFITDPETHEQLQKFIFYVFSLSKMGAVALYSLLEVTFFIGWEIIKFIPKIYNYLTEKNEEESDYPPRPEEPETENTQGFFSSLFSRNKGNKGNENDPEPSGGFFPEKIRKRTSSIVETLLEGGVDKSQIRKGLMEGYPFRPGLSFRHRKQSNRMRKRK